MESCNGRHQYSSCWHHLQFCSEDPRVSNCSAALICFGRLCNISNSPQVPAPCSRDFARSSSCIRPSVWSHDNLVMPFLLFSVCRRKEDLHLAHLIHDVLHSDVGSLPVETGHLRHRGLSPFHVMNSPPAFSHKTVSWSPL